MYWWSLVPAYAVLHPRATHAPGAWLTSDLVVHNDDSGIDGYQIRSMPQLADADQAPHRSE